MKWRGAARNTAAALIAALVAMLGWWYMVRLAPRWLRVVRLRVGIPALPAAWHGLRIAHLSDFHAGGPGVSLEHLWRARRAALAFQPHIVALTGDFYDNGRPIETHGLWTDWPPDTLVLAVLGNHDYRDGEASLNSLIAGLTAAGVRLLRNEAVEIDLRGKSAWVAGVDDPYTFRADEAATFAAVPADRDALLYLAHSPAVVTTMPEGIARLVLSGHTHGGQIRLIPSGRVPFLAAIRRVIDTGPRREPPVFRGYHWWRGAVLLISDGLGLSQLPARFRTRPQVLLIELAPAPLSGPACDSAGRFVTVLNPEQPPLSWLS